MFGASEFHGDKNSTAWYAEFFCVFFWGPAGASCLGASGHGDLRFVAILIASGACLGAAKMMGKHKRSNDLCLRVLSFVQNSFLTPGWGAMILHVFLFFCFRGKVPVVLPGWTGTVGVEGCFGVKGEERAEIILHFYSLAKIQSCKIQTQNSLLHALCQNL